MRISFNREFKSITEWQEQGEVPDFMVLTGPNGSGKSHLLQAIAAGSMSVTSATGHIPTSAIKIFGITELAVKQDSPHNLTTLNGRASNVANYVSAVVSQQSAHNPGHSVPFEEFLCQQIVDGNLLSRAALEEMRSSARKNISEFTANDFTRYLPMIPAVLDPFTFSVSELFLAYANRWRENDFLHYQIARRGVASSIPLSDDEFVAKHGPKPWELFTEILESLRLPYEFSKPFLEGNTEINFEVELVHKERGSRILIADLSSGERTLLALALSLYAGSYNDPAFRFPQLLLLDEADASLHPAMVNSLIRTLNETLSRTHEVRTILVTHSPTTVALAPEGAIYVMRNAGLPRIEHVSRDVALAALTVGVPALSVQVENRRQVFVESEYDEICYQSLFSLAKAQMDAEVSLEFIASGKRDRGGGCDAVLHLVGELRDKGNERVWGIVDRDDRKGALEGVVYLADRHSLENLVLDPLLIGLLLLRDRVFAVEDVCPGVSDPWFMLVPQHAQTIVDFISTQVGFVSNSSNVYQHYSGDYKVLTPIEWLETRGHDLEGLLLSTFPPLRKYGAKLKEMVISLVIGDVSSSLPMASIELFSKITLSTVKP